MWVCSVAARLPCPPMCNPHPIAPRDHVARHFRAMVLAYGSVPVGPFSAGLFLRPIDGRLQGVIGQWGMTQRTARARRPDSRSILTNNACSETVASRPSCRTVRAVGQRCLIPAARYQDLNRQTGRYVWWRMARAAGGPWAIARLGSEWTGPATDEIVPNFTVLNVNCVGHPLLGLSLIHI